MEKKKPGDLLLPVMTDLDLAPKNSWILCIAIARLDVVPEDALVEQTDYSAQSHVVSAKVKAAQIPHNPTWVRMNHTCVYPVTNNDAIAFYVFFTMVDLNSNIFHN